MDQAAALRCRVGHALLLDYRDGSIAQVPFDRSAHGLSLLIVDSRAEHALVDGQYAQRLPRSVRADVRALVEVPCQTPPPHDRCSTATFQRSTTIAYPHPRKGKVFLRSQ